MPVVTTRKLTPTERAIIAMLTENTGRAMCDSGDYYGRHWQRNQGRSFLNEPSTTLRIREYDGKPEIEVTHNVFHWLADRLDYEPAKTAAFKRFANKPVNKDKHWLELMEEFTDGKAGLYGDGSPMTVNTYNGEDLLSQTLQYTYWEQDGEAYVLLQIHGGADVRGGYTAPRVFRVMEETAIFDNARATIWEDAQEDTQDRLPGIAREEWGLNWSTDDGCHWYRDGACGRGVPAQLETYEVTHDPAERGNGKIYLDDDGTAYGPVCGGKLMAGF